MEKRKAIETKGLTKSYGRKRGIVDLSLTIEEGDFYGFIGPNGAGKSTTIRTLLGLISPDKGEARILGIECGRGKTQILKKIGYMPSEAQFYDRMRVMDVIRMAADLHNINSRAGAGEICERLQLDVNRKMDELSLGNRKKVSIVCAFQHEPEIYILDEPTSGLDPLIQREFFQMLKERNEKGATVFFSSHVMGEIQKYCRHAGIVREGKLIKSGTVEELAGSHAKRVTVTTREGVDTYLYNGLVNDLLEQLGRKEILDLTIAEPDLEEVVMHYYVKKDGKQVSNTL